MRISFKITDDLAQTLASCCEETRTGLDAQSHPISANEFAKECLEAELASRRLATLPKGTRTPEMAGERRTA